MATAPSSKSVSRPQAEVLIDSGAVPSKLDPSDLIIPLETQIPSSGGPPLAGETEVTPPRYLLLEEP